MTLKAIKVYQAVEFNRKLETYFVERQHMQDLEMSIYKDVGVLIKTKEDQIIVPFTNVAFMKTELSEADKKHPGREAKSGEGSAYRAK